MVEFLAKEQSLIAYFTYLDCSDNFLNKNQGLETQTAEGGRFAEKQEALHRRCFSLKKPVSLKACFSLGIAKFAAGGVGVRKS